MKFTVASTAVSVLGLLSTVSGVSIKKRDASDPIIIKGSKFFYKNTGEQFFIKGVAYQADYTGSDAASVSSGQTFIDPLANSSNCARDIPLLSALDTNVIRVYAIDATQNHDACMKMLVSAGIYVIADLSEPGLSINRDSPSWDTELYQRYTSVIDEMQQYNNVMGFFAGNEVTNNDTNTDASPFVKAAVRDMKAYIKSKGYRQIPIGYANNDDSTIRDNMASYFDCGDSSASVDFWGYNIYSWCGSSSLQTSGYADRVQEFQSYNIPVFFAEYGCNVPAPRIFTEVSALFGPVMSPVFSGGIVYMYFEEANDYGLVNIGNNGQATKLTDYNNFQTQITKATPSSISLSAYTPTNTAARACPTENATWAASTVLPPTPDDSLCNCIQSQFACVPASNLKETAYGAIFSYIFGQLSPTQLAGIYTNGTTGTYGSYSACSAQVRLGYALNQYYLSQNSASGACSFNGQAQIVTPSALNSSCQTQVSSAGGPSGTVVSGNLNGGGNSGGNGGGNSSSTGTGKPNAGVSLTVPAFNMMIALNVVVVLVSFFGGVGMIML